MNSEGYKDPTADRAVHQAGHLPERIWEVIKMARSMIELCHLDLTEIKVRDRKSKREYTWRR